MQKIRNSVFLLPDKIREDIHKLCDEQNGALWIVKRLREKYIGVKFPCIPVVNRYLRWYEMNRDAINAGKATTTPVIDTMGGGEDDPLATLDLSSGKDTLEVVREKIRTRIVKMEQQQEGDFDKYREQTIQKYYEMLRHLVHSGVELSPDLKDADIMKVDEVKLELTKVFSALRKVVDEMFPDRRLEFMQKLGAELVKSKSIEVPRNESLDIKANTVEATGQANCNPPEQRPSNQGDVHGEPIKG